MKDTLKIVGTLVTCIAVVAFLFWADFKVWKLQHPQAPTWTYIFK